MTAGWSMISANAFSRLSRGKAGTGFPKKSCSNQTAGAGRLFEEKPSRAGNAYSKATYSKATVHGDCSPPQGVYGDARLFGGGRIRAPGAGAGQFRPAR